jgi:CBS-domain-containing membrane protein
VACAQVIDQRAIAAALAVGMAITVMHQCKCIHPPGGATALTAVMAGPAVADLGFGYVLRPVLLNALCIVAVAVAFNALFPWRRYPAALRPRVRSTTEPASPSHDDVVTALRTLDSFVDVTEDDLLRLVAMLSDPRPATPRQAER